MELTIEQALQQGVAAHKEGKLQEAERLYRVILQSQPLHLDANHNLGLVAVSVNETAAALPLFKNALEGNPKIEQFWLSYIDALIKEQQFDNAKKVIQQGKQQGVDGERLSSLEAQLVPISQTKNVNSANPSQQQLNSLLEHYQNGRLRDAEKLAISITQEFSSHQLGWKVLGAVYRQTGRNSEAVDVNQTAVALSPQDATAHNNLGNTLQELGRLDEAEASCRRAITLKPDYAEAHNNLGNTLQELDRLDEAETSYKQAIAFKPDFAEAHYNLGITLQQLGRLDEAEASYSQAIAFKPDFAEAHNNLGDTLKELGRLDEAINSFKTAYRINPGLDTETGFAATYLRNGDPENALSLLEKFLKKYPQDVRANAYKTIALRGLDKFDQIEELVSFPHLVKKINSWNLIKEDMVAFNKELRSVLVQDPRRQPEDNLAGRAIRGGTVIRNLFDTENSSVRKFETVLRAAINYYIANLPDNTEHPFLMKKTENFQILNCWVNFLEPGDYQSNHIHNNGCISGVYYFDEPEIESNKDHAGWIEFNRAGYNLPHFAGEKGIELIKPIGGMFILFPSYVWHGTIPFTHSYSRISISFDIQLG